MTITLYKTTGHHSQEKHLQQLVSVSEPLRDVVRYLFDKNIKISGLPVLGQIIPFGEGTLLRYSQQDQTELITLANVPWNEYNLAQGPFELAEAKQLVRQTQKALYLGRTEEEYTHIFSIPEAKLTSKELEQRTITTITLEVWKGKKLSEKYLNSLLPHHH